MLVKEIFKDNAPQIIGGIGIGLAVLSASFAAKGGIEAEKILSEERKVLRTESTKPTEAVKKTWKCFIPAGVALVGCIVCIAGSNRLYLVRIGELTATVAALDSKLNTIEKATDSIFGEGSSDKVKNEVAQSEADKTMPKYGPLEGKFWCYEPESKQWFQTTKETVMMAELTANKIFKNDDRLTLNTFLSLFDGTHPVKWGNDFGWYIHDDDGYWDYNWSYYRGAPWIDIQPQMAKAPDGRDYLYLAYGMHPGEANDPDVDPSIFDEKFLKKQPPMPNS